jgi:hypothetical protein
MQQNARKAEQNLCDHQRRSPIDMVVMNDPRNGQAEEVQSNGRN